jgi:hypothetical protein
MLHMRGNGFAVIVEQIEGVSKQSPLQSIFYVDYLTTLSGSNIVNKQSRTSDKGWSSSLGVGREANKSSP